MKAIKKFLVLMMAAVLSLGVFGSFAGCNKDDYDCVDPAFTQLYVHCDNSVYETHWLDEVIKRFENDYRDYVSETGMVGVRVIPDYQKFDGMKDNKSHVIFTEDVNYYDFVAQGYCLDLTQMLSEPLTEYGETRSIKDKISDTVWEAMEIGADKKVYMVPHYAGYNGITLDIDLMDKEKLFLGEDGKFAYQESNKAPTTYTGRPDPENSTYLSAGQDGKFGTYDDGLPATYEEFFEFMEKLSKVATPIVWSGEENHYVTQMLSSMAVSGMGANDAEGFYAYNKNNVSVVKTDTISVDASQPTWNLSYQTETVNLTEATGYEVFRTPGFLTALNFIDMIVENGYYAKSSFMDRVTHTDIQDEFLQSSLDTEAFDKPIAMLVDGCWWEQEAAQTLKDLDDYYGDCGRMDRRLRFLPFPQIDEAHIGSGQVLFESSNAYGFVNANTPESYRELALAFLQYCNTDVSLREFSVVTSTPKALDYELTAEDKAKMSYYGRSLFDIQSAPDTKIVYSMANNETFQAKKGALGCQDIWVMNATTKTPSIYFKDNQTNSAKDYFISMYNNWKASW